jgi:hypothetical protein
VPPPQLKSGAEKKETKEEEEEEDSFGDSTRGSRYGFSPGSFTLSGVNVSGPDA